MVNRSLSSSMGKNVEKAVWQSRNQTGYLLLARTTLKDLMLTVSSMFKKYSQRFFFSFHFLCASENAMFVVGFWTECLVILI